MAVAAARPRAVFLDKDGTLVKDLPYNVDPELIRLVDGALDSLRLLQDAGFKLIVVSNQSGVARGFFPERALIRLEQRLRSMFDSAGIALTDFYYCPHHPQAAVPEYAVDCACRKPKPGMLLQAAREHHVDLSSSWMIGDILHDVQAGKAANCRTILVDNGNESEWNLAPDRRPDFVAKTLLEAAHLIIGDPGTTGRTFQHDNPNQRSAQYD